jgi:hypothetical protein
MKAVVALDDEEEKDSTLTYSREYGVVVYGDVDIWTCRL